MELRVASWNVDGWYTIGDAQLRLLDDSGAQLALLQEVTAALLDRLRAARWQGVSALELLPDGHTERAGARPRFACSVLARGEVPSPARNWLAGRPRRYGRLRAGCSWVEGSSRR